jgi:hypothetical protein
MPSSSGGSAEQDHSFRDAGLAPYAEVVAWRRRFYVALGGAIFALLALILMCASRL